MNFIIMLIIVMVLSAGILGLTFKMAPRLFRLAEERRFGIGFLKKKMVDAATKIGKSAALFRMAKREDLVNKELYSALSVMRNLASSNETGSCVTTDNILEQLAGTEGLLAKHSAGALRLLRTGRRAEAIEYFTSAAGVELARDFIMLVLDWDAVSPQKLIKTVSAFQNALRETRTTRLIRKNEALSDLVYLPVVACVLVIFVNFIYVAYFAEQQALLAELFY